MGAFVQILFLHVKHCSCTMLPMKNKTRFRKYPILAVRVSEQQLRYIRREADDKSVTVGEYVRAVLFPFEIPDDKK